MMPGGIRQASKQQELHLHWLMADGCHNESFCSGGERITGLFKGVIIGNKSGLGERSARARGNRRKQAGGKMPT
jgi:hypothetical protein